MEAIENAIKEEKLMERDENIVRGNNRKPIGKVTTIYRNLLR